MIDALSQPWPWYVAGPLTGLVVPMLLLLGGKPFGISDNFRHLCAAAIPGRVAFFAYDWQREGAWNLAFAAGLVLGGLLAATLLASPEPTIAISEATRADLQALGLTDLTGLVPSELISWHGLTTLPGFVLVVGGGFLLGFGARYAGGCTSGHCIMGLADRQLPSLVAVAGFMGGGIFATYVLLPLLL
jgi:uncharacterized membrane protein YedE/YeeE